MKKRKKTGIGLLIAVAFMTILLLGVIKVSSDEKVQVINKLGQEVNLGYEKDLEENNAEILELVNKHTVIEQEGLEVISDTSKGYLIDKNILIYKGEGKILLYNDEENDFNIKAILEVIKKTESEDGTIHKEIVATVETKEVRPGYFIEDILIKEMKKQPSGYYGTKVKIIKVKEDEETVIDAIGILIVNYIKTE